MDKAEHYASLLHFATDNSTAGNVAAFCGNNNAVST